MAIFHNQVILNIGRIQQSFSYTELICQGLVISGAHIKQSVGR